MAKHSGGRRLLQTHPRWRCGCGAAFAGRRCYGPRCSVEGRRNWAWRERSLIEDRLRVAAALGRSLHEATLKFADAEATTIEAVVRRFKAGMADANRRLRRRRGSGSGDIRYRAYVHVVGDAGGLPHLHVLIHTTLDPDAVKERLRAIWADAGGDGTRVHAAPIRDVEAMARYATGDLAGVRGGDEPSVLAHNGIPPAFGNQFYGPGGEKRAWESLRRRWHPEPPVGDVGEGEVTNLPGEPSPASSRPGHRDVEPAADRPDPAPGEPVATAPRSTAAPRPARVTRGRRRPAPAANPPPPRLRVGTRTETAGLGSRGHASSSPPRRRSRAPPQASPSRPPRAKVSERPRPGPPRARSRGRRRSMPPGGIRHPLRSRPTPHARTPIGKTTRTHRPFSPLTSDPNRPESHDPPPAPNDPPGRLRRAAW